MTLHHWQPQTSSPISSCDHPPSPIAATTSPSTSTRPPQQLRHRPSITMSLDPPTYLASLQSNIRQRPIPWDGAVRAGTLTDEQYNKIRAVDKAKKPEQRKETVEGDIEGYRLLFVGAEGKKSVLESASQHTNVIQYILVLLSDLLDGKCNPWPSLVTATWHDQLHKRSPARVSILELLLDLGADMRPLPRCPFSRQSPLQEHQPVPTFLTAP